jgi:hypothetical protein
MMEFLRKYRVSIISILATLILGIAVVLIWANVRMNVTPEEQERARTNCVEWMQTYDIGDDASSAILACQTAENADPRSFFFRWVPGQYGKIDPPEKTDIPQAVDAG